jgi:hypothetical protein
MCRLDMYPKILLTCEALVAIRKLTLVPNALMYSLDVIRKPLFSREAFTTAFNLTGVPNTLMCRLDMCVESNS